MMRHENDWSRDSHFDDDDHQPSTNKGADANQSGESNENSSGDSVGNQQQLFDCPICQHKFFRTETPAMPFCSRRCQQVDMGRWLTESYGMPYDSEDAIPLDDEEYESGF